MARENNDMLDDAALEDMFGAARDSAQMPSRDLWRRVQAAAEAHLPHPEKAAARAPERRRMGALLAALGGWGALAGLSGAAMVGLWIGYAQPTITQPFKGAAPVAGFELEDFEPGANAFVALLEDG